MYRLGRILDSMEPASSSNTGVLRDLEFELAYLSLLAKEGLKPLSRWEKPFDGATEECLRRLGLKTCVVNRFVQTGKPVRELLMSVSDQPLEAYATRFAGSPINQDYETIRFEGRLFGYPACCVDSYVARGYVKNSLRRRDQRILFHWACPRCAVSPLLVADYRRVYRACGAARRGGAWRVLPDFVSALGFPELRPRVALAISLALGILPATTVPGAAGSLDPHLIAEPAGTDLDQDGLRNWEEPAFGTDPQNPDCDGDELIDGVDTARELRLALDTLPAVGRREDGPTDRPFVLNLMMNGLETCPRCGEVQTMGLWEVINPVIADSVTIPTMAIHYLDHGAFGWNGGRLLGGQGRVDPRQLQALLTGTPNRHLLAVTLDQDGDFLADPEEVSLGGNPVNQDEDQNAVRDGLDLARRVACEIAGLPTTPSSNQVYRLDFPLRGLERCETCGTNVNMGYLTVHNAQAHLSVEVPYIAVHYLEHDSFSFSGDVHGAGRTGVKMLLDALFRPAVDVVADAQRVTLRWRATAGRTYQVFTAVDLHSPWNSGPVFQGDGAEKVFTESVPAGAAKRFYRVVVR